MSAKFDVSERISANNNGEPERIDENDRNNLVDEKTLEKAREMINKEILKDSVKEFNNKVVVAKFMNELKEHIIPEVEFVVSSMIPTYAYKREMDAVKTIWKCFEAVVALDDPKVNNIIAHEVEKYEKKKGHKEKK